MDSNLLYSLKFINMSDWKKFDATMLSNRGGGYYLYSEPSSLPRWKGKVISKLAGNHVGVELTTIVVNRVGNVMNYVMRNALDLLNEQDRKSKTNQNE